jgi:hypothetical protein
MPGVNHKNDLYVDSLHLLSEKRTISTFIRWISTHVNACSVTRKGGRLAAVNIRRWINKSNDDLIT